MNLICSGVRNVWHECKKEGGLEGLRLILRFSTDDFVDVLKYGGLLTKDDKFKLHALIEGTMLDFDERRTFNTKKIGQRTLDSLQR